jgi:hypothetical protein
MSKARFYFNAAAVFMQLVSGNIAEKSGANQRKSAPNTDAAISAAQTSATMRITRVLVSMRCFVCFCIASPSFPVTPDGI